MKKIEDFFDRLHIRVIDYKILRLFTAFLRPLLGLAFIPPSIPKILHQPFTMLPKSNPVGAYFGALYETGYYYDFIGWSQLLAAILLLIPRTSHLGALLFLPIILNITVLTNSVGFRGTWLVTILMFLACLYLVCWDYPRWKSILFFKYRFGNKPSVNKLILISLIVGIVPVLCIFLIVSITGAFNSLFGFGTFVMLIGGSVFGLLVAIHFRFLESIEITTEHS